ncbi:keratin-like protein KRT222 [Hemitrygon akajei]|uniref:keratin-like protein KRT222 n=1 Tax=Hemitrygon akajei TaxID=2704970 RepID=UPI003BF94C1A
MELSRLLADIQRHYEQIVLRSRQLMDSYCPQAPEGGEAELSDGGDGDSLQSARAELKDARRQWQSLQLETESLRALRKGLERSLQAAERRHERRLRDLAGVVEGLEGELREARTDVGRQARKHQLLLNTKMRLEGEIARYRGLLEGEEGSLAATAAVGPRSSHTWLRQKTVTLPSAPSSPNLVAHPPRATGIYTDHHFRPFTLPPKNAKAGSGIFPGTGTREATLCHSRGCNPASRCNTRPLNPGSLLVAVPDALTAFAHLLARPKPGQAASLEQRIETATTQEIPSHGMESESPKAPSKVQTEKMDELIKGWECSFFKDNPHLRKKSASLRFDLHLAAAEGGSPPGKRGALPDIELRLVMRKSSSIPSLKS